MSTHTAVTLSGVTKTFRTDGGTLTAVDGVDLTVNAGEIVAFLGPNGAGKTTTIDMILGLTAPVAGSISVLGTTPRKAVQAGRVSALLQTGGLLHDLTVKETVTSIASLYRLGTDRVHDVMERTGLTRLASRKVSKCSGGEQQRLKFALALLPDPDVLILDEPTAGMDVSARREFWSTMQSEAQDGRTVIFATHYLQEAEDFSERTILMNNGVIIADGPTAQIRSIAAGRTVSVVLPPDFDATTLDALPGVTAVHRNGDRVVLTTTESDNNALHLLTHGARDMEITAPSLESAFVQLTSKESQ
ncbi:ABC transporter ATP-binding protein [Jonesia quinghaiensis]|uniref:ABC transporter ATP-binding protein n=1 Tax=Jonesia quinghaiensis TaxID=262806 RepID=UPI000412AE54|nr:ABC transporter ATP-binding protein [Jonesia quinghaiensis]